MDYKELIENLKKVTAGLQEDDAPKCAAVCEEAATAIETLLAEREAAIEMLNGMCHACKHSERDFGDDLCRYCYEGGGMSDNWQWRGPTPPDRQQAEKE